MSKSRPNIVILDQLGMFQGTLFSYQETRVGAPDFKPLIDHSTAHIPDGGRPQTPLEPLHRTHREWPHRPLVDWPGGCRRVGRRSGGTQAGSRWGCRWSSASAPQRSSSSGLHRKETGVACWRRQRQRLDCNQSERRKRCGKYLNLIHFFKRDKHKKSIDTVTITAFKCF